MISSAWYTYLFTCQLVNPLTKVSTNGLSVCVVLYISDTAKVNSLRTLTLP